MCLLSTIGYPFLHSQKLHSNKKLDLKGPKLNHVKDSIFLIKDSMLT